MAPHKPHPRQRQQDQSSTTLNQMQASDYDSEHYNTTSIPSRSNTTLNLAVLRRYNPSISSILSIAASAVIYHFTPPSSWEKSGIEGTLFVCELAPHPVTGVPGYAVVVLNRRGLDNFVLDVAEMQDVEITNEYLILSYLERTEAWDMQRRIVGVFMHPDKDDTREINSLLVKKCWESLKKTGKELELEGEMGDEGTATPGIRDGMEKGPGLGRKLSLRDLFAQQSMR